MVQSYRDLSIPLRNDLLWNIELAKLQGEPVSIPEKIKEKMIESAMKAKHAFPAGLRNQIDAINSILAEIQEALIAKVPISK